MTIELIERAKNECAGIFAEATKENDPAFGLRDREFDAGLLLATVSLRENFPGISKLFLPKPVQLMIKTNHGDVHGRDNLDIVHYQLNNKIFKKRVRKSAETNRYLLDHIKKNSPGSVPPRSLKPFDADEFYAWFQEKFGPATCMRHEVWGESYLLGRKELMQEIVDSLKQNTEDIFPFMKELMGKTGSRVVDAERSRIKTVSLYDLVESPKEIHQTI